MLQVESSQHTHTHSGTYTSQLQKGRCTRLTSVVVGVCGCVSVWVCVREKVRALLRKEASNRNDFLSWLSLVWLLTIVCPIYKRLWKYKLIFNLDAILDSYCKIKVLRIMRSQCNW